MTNWNGKAYHSLDYYIKKTWGEKLYKLSLNGGMTCPNRDGTLGSRGCIFCSKGGSGDFTPSSDLSVIRQIEEAKKLVAGKSKAVRFIAYFQAFTNTYAPVSHLEKIFTEAIEHPEIAVLSIATRPDCLPPDVLELLNRLNQIKPVWVELGLQSVHQKTSDYIRRGYPLSVFEESLKNLRTQNIDVIVHTILGLPGETEADMLETIDYLAHKDIQGIKLQLLHVLKDTDLADAYLNGDFDVPDQGSYIRLLIRCIEHLPPEIVIHRISGDGPGDLLIAPEWSRNKRNVLNQIQKAFKAFNTFQGKKFIQQEAR